MIKINEYTRTQLVNMSKTPGYNRYSRRMTVGGNEITIDKVVISKPTSKSNDLDVYFKVRDYVCSIRLVNFFKRVRILRRQSKYSNDIRKLLDLSLMNTIERNDLLINCTCPDFYYRFSYVATVKKFGFNTNQTIPARIRNPKNKGSGCKHLMRIINAPYIWKGKVITAVRKVIEEDPSIID